MAFSESFRLVAQQDPDRAVIEVEGEFYVVSSIKAAPDHGQPETLIFRSDEDGEIIDWADVAGGPNLSQAEAIAMLLEEGPVPYAATRNYDFALMLTAVLDELGRQAKGM